MSVVVLAKFHGNRSAIKLFSWISRLTVAVGLSLASGAPCRRSAGVVPREKCLNLSSSETGFEAKPACYNACFVFNLGVLPTSSGICSNVIVLSTLYSYTNSQRLVSFAAVIRIVTQPFSTTNVGGGEALRDDPNDGCKAKETS